MRREIVHALNPAGHGEDAMCGYVIEAFEDHMCGDGGAAGRFEHMRPGLVVTCPLCCRAIQEMRAALKGVRCRPSIQEEGE